MASAALLQKIKGGNLHHCVPEENYEKTIKSIYSKLLESGLIQNENVDFNPEKHLQYYAGGESAQQKYDNTRRLSLEELGISDKDLISPVGVSDPFPLFTDEAVSIMKKEVLNKDLFMKYARHSATSSSGLDCTIRGFVKNGDKINAPFTYQAWTHPKTVELVSKMAGVELEVVMDYEIAHTNVGMRTPESVNAYKNQKATKSLEQTLKEGDDGEEIDAIIGWHHDSYPFVCVLMLSDTSKMVGGETALRMGGDGKKVAVVPGPQLGSASVLQGRIIEHIAPSPKDSCERITMVTSYRAKNPLLNEGSVLKTVKPEVNFGSRYNDFYPQWIAYRCKLLQERLQHLSENCRDENGDFDKEYSENFLKGIEKYVKATYEEMQLTDQEWHKATLDRFDKF